MLSKCIMILDNFRQFDRRVDKWANPENLSPGLLDLAIFVASCTGSALERLLENVQLLVQFRYLLAFSADLAYGMQDRGVVSSTK